MACSTTKTRTNSVSEEEEELWLLPPEFLCEDNEDEVLLPRFNFNSNQIPTPKPKTEWTKSPQSTLSWSGDGSPNGGHVASERDTWQLIYAAAGEVARLKRQVGPFYPHSGWAPVTRPSSGTGVFLPRKYPLNPPHPTKRHLTGCPKVAHSNMNMNFKGMNFVGHVNPRFACGFAPNHNEALIARRNLFLEQQRRNSLRPQVSQTHEIQLPQEWTY